LRPRLASRAGNENRREHYHAPGEQSNTVDHGRYSLSLHLTKSTAAMRKTAACSSARPPRSREFRGHDPPIMASWTKQIYEATSQSTERINKKVDELAASIAWKDAKTRLKAQLS
jgi:hypothetical protein